MLLQHDTGAYSVSMFGFVLTRFGHSVKQMRLAENSPHCYLLLCKLVPELFLSVSS